MFACLVPVARCTHARETRRATEGASDTDREAKAQALVDALMITARQGYGPCGVTRMQPDGERRVRLAASCLLLGSHRRVLVQLGNFHPNQKGTIVFGRTLPNFTPAPARPAPGPAHDQHIIFPR
eukprot:2757238-Prymnesium_polylepis.1